MRSMGMDITTHLLKLAFLLFYHVVFCYSLSLCDVGSLYFVEPNVYSFILLKRLSVQNSAL